MFIYEMKNDYCKEMAKEHRHEYTYQEACILQSDDIISACVGIMFLMFVILVFLLLIKGIRHG